MSLLDPVQSFGKFGVNHGHNKFGFSPAKGSAGAWVVNGSVFEAHPTFNTTTPSIRQLWNGTGFHITGLGGAADFVLPKGRFMHHPDLMGDIGVASSTTLTTEFFIHNDTAYVLTIVPSAGYLFVGNTTVDAGTFRSYKLIQEWDENTYKIAEASGTVAAASDLEATLAVGNESGAYDIDMDNGQKLLFKDAIRIEGDSDGNGADENIWIGRLAGAAYTSATFATAVGTGALQALTSGTRNSAVGYGALAGVTFGYSNTAIGYDAGKGITTNYGNTFIGNNAGSNISCNAIGSTVIGSDAAMLMTGSANTVIGAGTAAALTSGVGDILIGNDADVDVGTDDYGVAIGTSAVVSSNSVAIGLNSNTSGTAAIAIGSSARATDSAIAIGNNALAVSSGINNNTAVGSNALAAMTTGANNTALGRDTLSAATTGDFNTAVGDGAIGIGVTTGNYNTAVGARSFYDGTAGEHNVYVGYSTGENATTGDQNVAVGSNALLYMTTGSYNTVVGYLAGYYIGSGNNNCLVGRFAGIGLTTGTSNVCFGSSAGNNIIAASNNVCIGRDADLVGDDTQAVAIGASSEAEGYSVTVGYSSESQGAYSSVFGFQANASSSYAVALGAYTVGNVSNGLFFRTSLASIPAAGNTAVYFDSSTGQMGPDSSSARFKTDIVDANLDTDSLFQLRARQYKRKDPYCSCMRETPLLEKVIEDGVERFEPVKESYTVTKTRNRFNEKTKEKETFEEEIVKQRAVMKPPQKSHSCTEVGFIAEEVEAAGLGHVVSHDPEGRPQSLDYARLVVVAVEALKVERQARLKQQDHILRLEGRLAALEVLSRV